MFAPPIGPEGPVMTPVTLPVGSGAPLSALMTEHDETAVANATHARQSAARCTKSREIAAPVTVRGSLHD